MTLRFWSSIQRLVALAFLITSCGAMLYAQSTTDGAIGGTVYDTNGAVIANAKVVGAKQWNERGTDNNNRCVRIFSRHQIAVWLLHGQRE